MNAKRIVALIVASLLLLTLPACGSGGGAPTASPDASVPTAGTPAASNASTAGAPPAPEPASESGAYIDGVWKYNEPITVNALFSYDAAKITEEEVPNIWLFEYARQEMNIDIVPIAYPVENADSVAGLLMASNEYPEAILYFHYNFTGVGNHAKYGDQAGQLLPLNRYLTDPEIMPNVSKIMEEFAAEVPVLATATGNIYQLPTVGQHAEFVINMSNQFLWYDTRVLEAVGKTAPKTTDEFLEFLRAVKATDPKGLGENNIPLGGRNGSYIPFAPLLNAFGFVTGDPNGLVSQTGGAYIGGPGELVPLQTHPNFLGFLRYMNTLYTEGLFDQDYWTQEIAQAVAKASTDYYTVFPSYNTFDFAEESFTSYEVLSPMTSAVSTEPFLNAGATQLGGNYMMFLTNKATEEQSEAMMRFADRCFDERFRFSAYFGPEAGVDDDYGLGFEGWYLDEGKNRLFKDLESGKFVDRSEYSWHVTPFDNCGNAFDRRTDGSENEFFDPAERAGRMNYEIYHKLDPYLVRGMPAYAAKEGDVTRMNDLGTVLGGMVSTEVTRFITGARLLTDEEFAAYGGELSAAGYDEYCRTYIDTQNETYK